MINWKRLLTGESAIGLLSFGVAGLIAVTYVLVGVWPAELHGWGIPLFVLIGLLLISDDLRGRLGKTLPVDG